MPSLPQILGTFAPVTLKEMEGVKLMKRRDTKFTFGIDLLPEILKQARPHYKCLQLERKRISTYHTLYYDTGDLMLYHKHQSGALNRYKIRHRSYVESGLGFLEVKFKNNKGRTIKERIKQKTAEENFDKEARDFLNREIPFSPSLLMPVVWVNYKRITLVNKLTAERVTIDIDLEFRNGDKRMQPNNLVIAEAKQDKKTVSAFIKLMRTMRVREGSISKYCFAIACTRNNVKKNNFKEKLYSFKHILDYDVITNSY